MGKSNINNKIKYILTQLNFSRCQVILIVLLEQRKDLVESFMYRIKLYNMRKTYLHVCSTYIWHSYYLTGMRISRDCFANFDTDFRKTFVRLSHECREDFHVSRTSRELVAKVLNMFKILSKFFRQIISQDCRASVVRRSCDGRATFVRVSRTCRLEILANLQCKFSRHSYECRASVKCDSLETTCENLATRSTCIWREIKTKRHSYECRATLARMPRDTRTN